MISYNAVYHFVSDRKRIRILDLDRASNSCVFIYIEGEKCMPICERLEALVALLESNDLLEIIDTFYDVAIEGNYSEKDYLRCEERYALIQRYWPDQKERLLNKKTRGIALKEIAQKEDIPLTSIKRLFSQFWQQGMRKSALFSSYSNSGGKGKKRILKNKSGAKRVDGNTGLIIDERIEKIFATVIKCYYEIEKKPSLQRVYYQMLDEFFSKSLMIDGEKKKILFDEDHCPTFKQFKYYFNNNIDRTECYKARETENKYELKRRPLKDTATRQICGPGAKNNKGKTLMDIIVEIILDTNDSGHDCKLEIIN